MLQKLYSKKYMQTLYIFDKIKKQLHST